MTDLENPHAGHGSVLLDIGGDIGALVVTMPTSMLGEEVDIRRFGSEDGGGSPAHDHGHAHAHGHSHDDGHGHGRPHVAVVARPMPGGGEAVASLVYPDLTGGSYDLLPKGTDDVVLTVHVRGGEVATATWPELDG